MPFALREAMPRRMPLAWCKFTALRQNLLKIDAWVVKKAAHVRTGRLPRGGGPRSSGRRWTRQRAAPLPGPRRGAWAHARTVGFSFEDYIFSLKRPVKPDTVLPSDHTRGERAHVYGVWKLLGSAVR